MEYRVKILDVGDADAIIIEYKEKITSPWITVLIDAGNVGAGDKIKENLKKTDGKYVINYAFCTHPDKDHKGGFFDLLDDKSVKIQNLCLMDPCDYIGIEDFAKVKKQDNARIKARACWNHPEDKSKNLIDIAIKKGIFQNISIDSYFNNIPITILGPSDDFYREIVLGMVSNFAEINDSPDTSFYDEIAKVFEEDAKSVIDKDDDDSYTNGSSLILLFEPSENRKFLLTGDASCSSLADALFNTDKDFANCILKVPHHGSEHNLNTELIDFLSPSSAVISAKGSRKHPNSGIVYWLSKYCNVYSTHKSGTLIYTSEKTIHKATPLKEKITEE